MPEQSSARPDRNGFGEADAAGGIGIVILDGKKEQTVADLDSIAGFELARRDGNSIHKRSVPAVQIDERHAIVRPANNRVLPRYQRIVQG